MTLNKYGSNIQEFYWKGRPIIEGYRYGRQFWPVAKENKVSGGTPIKTYIYNPVSGMREDSTPLGADFKLTDPYNDSYKEPVVYGGFIHLYRHEGGDPSDDTAYVILTAYSGETSRTYLKRGQWVNSVYSDSPIGGGAPETRNVRILNHGYHGAIDIRITAKASSEWDPYWHGSIIPGINKVITTETSPEQKTKGTWEKPSSEPKDYIRGTFTVAENVDLDTVDSTHNLAITLNNTRIPGLGNILGATAYSIDLKLGYITYYRTDLLDKDVYLEATKYTEENEEGEVTYNSIYMQWVENLNENCIMRGSFDQNLDLYNLTYIV